MLLFYHILYYHHIVILMYSHIKLKYIMCVNLFKEKMDQWMDMSNKLNVNHNQNIWIVTARVRKLLKM